LICLSSETVSIVVEQKILVVREVQVKREVFSVSDMESSTISPSEGVDGVRDELMLLQLERLLVPSSLV